MRSSSRVVWLISALEAHIVVADETGHEADAIRGRIRELARERIHDGARQCPNVDMMRVVHAFNAAQAFNELTHIKVRSEMASLKLWRASAISDRLPAKMPPTSERLSSAR